MTRHLNVHVGSLPAKKKVRKIIESSDVSHLAARGGEWRYRRMIHFILSLFDHRTPDRGSFKKNIESTPFALVLHPAPRRKHSAKERERQNMSRHKSIFPRKTLPCGVESSLSPPQLQTVGGRWVLWSPLLYTTAATKSYWELLYAFHSSQYGIDIWIFYKICLTA